MEEWGEKADIKGAGATYVQGKVRTVPIQVPWYKRACTYMYVLLYVLLSVLDPASYLPQNTDGPGTEVPARLRVSWVIV